MGCNIFARNSSCDHDFESTKSPIDPDPKKFSIVKHRVIGEYITVKVNYPNCTNYEGNKIIVYNAKKCDVLLSDFLDPHFCDGDHIIPIARFVPTEKGWKMAIKLMETL